MIEQAKAVAQRLRGLTEEGWASAEESANTIDALVADAEQYLSDWKACTAMNRELLAEVERLKQEQAEPVLRIRTWTKTNRFTGTQEGHGEIVAWLDGSDSLPDGEHDLYTAPQGQTELLKQALEALEEATHYTSTPAWSPSMTRDCEIVVTAIKRHLGEA